MATNYAIPNRDNGSTSQTGTSDQVGWAFHVARSITVTSLRQSGGGGGDWTLRLWSDNGTKLAEVVVTQRGEAVLAEPVTLELGVEYAVTQQGTAGQGRRLFRDADGASDVNDRWVHDFVTYLSAISHSGMGAPTIPGTDETRLWGIVDFGFDVVPGAEYVRTTVQEDAGSILENTQAIPSEVNAEIALDKAATLAPGELHQIDHPLDPSTILFRGYAHATSNSEHLNTYTFETKLGRMARTFPPKIWERVDQIPSLAADLVDGEKVSAQAALQYIFDQWASTYPWFSAEPVPDLRTWRADDDYSGTKGVLYVFSIRIKQTEDSRKSMLSILDEWLSPFSLTPRQNSVGNIELVPQHGPNADMAPTKVLTDADIVWPGLSDGGADARSAKNLVRLSNQGDVRRDDVQVMEPAWLQIASRANFGYTDVLFPPPAAQRNLSPGTDADGNEDQLVAIQSQLTPSDAFTGQGIRWFWPLGSESMPAGEDGIRLTDSLGTQQITASYAASDGAGNLRDSRALTADEITVATIPYSGEWVEAIRLDYGQPHAVILGRWNEARQGVDLRLGDAQLETGWPGWYTTFAVNLQDASVGITEGEVNTATVGEAEPDGTYDDFLPGTEGNAIAQSQATNGINEANLDIRVYTVEPGALVDIGLGYLYDNIEPRTIRAGMQSPHSGMPLVPDDIGHLVQLGDGSQAILLSCGFTMDFSPGHGSPVLASPVRFLVVTDPVIDTTTNYLHFADGSYFELADGTISEEA